MSEPERRASVEAGAASRRGAGAPPAEARLVGEVAGLAGAIERAAADLAIAEEPAGFTAALEGERDLEARRD